MQLSLELPQILRDLNSWWEPPHPVRPAPLPYRRRNVEELQRALRARRPLIQVLRGPRQVGKTTALYQVVEAELREGTPPREILLVRFDLQPVQEAGLLPIVRWYEAEILARPFDRGSPPLLLLDEVHKLPRWAGPGKHICGTVPP